MQEVTTFHYHSHEFRSVQDGETILFIAKDVCQALELEDVSKACQNIPEDEKLIRTLFVSGQNRNLTCITESGLYRLIFRSNKPEAEVFRTWVFNEVLPAIRKTGSYQPELSTSTPILSDLGLQVQRATIALADPMLTSDQTWGIASDIVQALFGLDSAELLGHKEVRQCRLGKEKNATDYPWEHLYCYHKAGRSFNTGPAVVRYEDDLIKKFLDIYCETKNNTATPVAEIYQLFAPWFEERFSFHPGSEEMLLLTMDIKYRNFCSTQPVFRVLTIAGKPWFLGLAIKPEFKAVCNTKEVSA